MLFPILVRKPIGRFQLSNWLVGCPVSEAWRIQHHICSVSVVHDQPNQNILKSQGAATGVDYQLGDLEGENGELLLVTTDMDVKSRTNWFCLHTFLVSALLLSLYYWWYSWEMFGVIGCHVAPILPFLVVSGVILCQSIAFICIILWLQHEVLGCIDDVSIMCACLLL